MANQPTAYDRYCAEELLDSLRWCPDTVITNPFGERVWLKEYYANGKRIGITDCCPEDLPCDWHLALAKSGGGR